MLTPIGRLPRASPRSWRGRLARARVGAETRPGCGALIGSLRPEQLEGDDDLALGLADVTDPTAGTFSAVIVRRDVGDEPSSPSTTGGSTATGASPHHLVLEQRLASAAVYSHALFSYEGATCSRAATVMETTSVKAVRGIDNLTDCDAIDELERLETLAVEGITLVVATEASPTVTSSRPVEPGPARSARQRGHEMPEVSGPDRCSSCVLTLRPDRVATKTGRRRRTRRRRTR